MKKKKNLIENKKVILYVNNILLEILCKKHACTPRKEFHEEGKGVSWFWLGLIDWLVSKAMNEIEERKRHAKSR